MPSINGTAAIPPHKTALMSKFQCGDKSHEAYRHKPALEGRIRHNCDLPKIQSISTDEKGRTVVTIIHRAVVTKSEVESLHKREELGWAKAGGKLVKTAKKAEDKALTDRQELEDDGWEVLHELDVDDRRDVVGGLSGKGVTVLEDGLQ